MTAAAASVRGGDAVRAALVEAAAEMLGDVGPRALSVRDVARRAGVNHGQVHHYFGSKRALFEAAMRKLAQDHYDASAVRAGGRGIPPALSLARDPAYWRAVCHVVMDGDLDLARIEIDEDVSVPRRVLRVMMERWGVREDDLAFRARFATAVAVNLGWVAFEEFVLLVSDVDERDRETVREEVKKLIESLISGSPAVAGSPASAGADGRSPWSSD